MEKQRKMNGENLRLGHDGASYGTVGIKSICSQNEGDNRPHLPGVKDTIPDNGLAELTAGAGHPKCQTHWGSHTDSTLD